MREVICFGEALWDLYEVERGAYRRELGGAQANVATGLARLGLSVAFMGAVGRDALGDALVEHLAADGVDVRPLRRLPGRTGITLVRVDARGQPQFTPYRERAADQALLPAHLEASAGTARWAVVGTNAPAPTTERFLRIAEQGGARLAVDLNVRPHLWPDARAMRSAIAALAGRASLVKASDADLRELRGRAGGELRWLELHAPRATWIVTRGARQASAVGEHGEVRLSPAETRCVDAAGAGDAFLAGALATVVSARATPGSGAWRSPELWGLALRAGQVMARKAISRRGAVAGLVGLAGVRSIALLARRRFG
jgi:fructokinase